MVGLIILLVYLIYSLNLFSYIDDLDNISSSRLSIWKEVLCERIKFWGNGISENVLFINNKNYWGGAHNAFIDLLYRTGILVTLLYGLLSIN